MSYLVYICVLFMLWLHIVLIVANDDIFKVVNDFIVYVVCHVNCMCH